MTKPKHKYAVKRVIVDWLGWEYNENRKVWEMWHRGKVYWTTVVSTKTVIHDFIDYEYSQL